MGAAGPRRRAPRGRGRLATGHPRARTTPRTRASTTRATRAAAGGPGRRRRAPGAPRPARSTTRCPEKFADTVQAGCRVRVRFSGQLVDGFVLRARGDDGVHRQAAAARARAVGRAGAHPAGGAAGRGTIADRYAGTMSDVLRLARAAAAGRRGEAADPDAGRAARAARPGRLRPLPGRPGAARPRWPRGGPPGRSGRRCPGRTGRPGWSSCAGRRCRDGAGRWSSSPTARTSTGSTAAAGRLLPEHSFTVLRAGDSPGEALPAVPRRLARQRPRSCWAPAAAMFAPVRDLGLVVVWDDGDDLHSERARALSARPRRPRPAGLAGQLRRGGRRAPRAPPRRRCSWSPAGRTSWSADRAALRAAAPRVQALGDDFELARDPAARSARLPSLAHEAARKALAAGAPVLVQVPRRGYVPSLACARCRAPARCAHCAGPLGISPAPGPGRHADPGLPVVRPPGGHLRLPALPRHQAAGRRRGGVPHRGGAGAGLPRRGGAHVRAARLGVLATVPGGPALVVATPGAEPVAEGGYGAALLLDSWALLGRADLRAGEETLRRWMNAATLVRPASAGGLVVVAADAGAPRRPGAGALGPGLAGRARARRPPRAGLPAGHPDRVAVGLPGGAGGVPRGAAAARRTPTCWARCPSRRGPGRRASGSATSCGCPRAEGAALAHALAEVQGVRSAKKAPEHVRVQLDPLDLV